MKINTCRSRLFIRFFSLVPMMALVLLSLSCKKSPTKATDSDPKPRTFVPVALVGEWQSGTVSSVNFYNPATGTWAPPSGTGMFFNFKADGNYEKGVLLQSSLYGHSSTFYAYNRGSFTVQDNQIILYPPYGRIKSVDSWIAENNYEKADELSSETMLWEKGVDEYGLETLWLRYPEGNSSAFHRPL